MDIDPLPATEPLSLLLNITSLISLNTPDFGSGQVIALLLALGCLVMSGFVSGSEMAYFSLTEAQLDELDKDSRGPGIRRLMTDQAEIAGNDTYCQQPRQRYHCSAV